MNIEGIKQTIAIVAPYFPPEGGGAERYAYEISTRLSNLHGYKVIVITTAGKGEIDSVIEENGLTVYRLKYDFKISNTPLSFSWFWKINKIIRKEKPIAINIHMPVPGLGDIVSFLSGGIPTIINYHSGTMKKVKSKLNCLVYVYESLFLPIVLNNASKIFSDSEDVRIKFLKKYSYKSLTLTPAANTKVFKMDSSKKPVDPTILFVASLNYADKYKGLEKLLVSLSQVRKSTPTIRLNVVGDGNMKNDYIEMAKELGIGDAVTFHGRLCGEALYEQYKKSNIMVHPSSNESFSLVILEGMAASLPVIAIDVGGTKELISDGIDGFVLPNNNPELISEKLTKLISNPDLMAKFSNSARTKIENNFQWEDRVNVYAKFLKSISNIEINKESFSYKNLNRIAIIGQSATGKSTLSKKIAEITGLPLFHIDDYIWIGKWEKFPEAEYLNKHKELINSKEWIIEGYIDRKMSERIDCSDLVIYLDYSIFTCSFRYIKRWNEHRKKYKFSNSNDPSEKFSLKLVFIVFWKTLLRSEKKEIESLIKITVPNRVLRISSPKKLDKFLMGSQWGIEAKTPSFTLAKNG